MPPQQVSKIIGKYCGVSFGDGLWSTMELRSLLLVNYFATVEEHGQQYGTLVLARMNCSLRLTVKRILEVPFDDGAEGTLFAKPNRMTSRWCVFSDVGEAAPGRRRLLNMLYRKIMCGVLFRGAGKNPAVWQRARCCVAQRTDGRYWCRRRRNVRYLLSQSVFERVKQQQTKMS